MSKNIVFVLAVLVVAFVSVYLLKQNHITPAPETNSIVSETSLPEENLEELDWEAYEFPEVGLSFSAPFEMEVTGEMVDEHTFTLYVQRSAYPQAEYYQLYGLYNLNGTKDISKEDLKTELNEDSIEETTISGFEAVKGQYKGERNRFVTYIITDRGLFNLATAQPTQENKELTDQILKTFILE